MVEVSDDTIARWFKLSECLTLVVNLFEPGGAQLIGVACTILITCFAYVCILHSY